jgi:hypothetical protein
VNQENPAGLLLLLVSLDEAMSIALTEGSLVCASVTPARPLGFAMFLCALYIRRANELLPYFNDAVGFNSLRDALWPAELPTSQEGLSGLFDETDVEPNTAPGYYVELDPDLTRVLVNAARISFALLQLRTTIRDLIASMAVEVQIRESLGTVWGIWLKRSPDIGP